MYYDKNIFELNLSYKAIGLYIYLAHLESLNGITQMKLANRVKSSEGISAVRSGLKELVEHGCLSRHKLFNGHIIWRLSRGSSTTDVFSSYKYWSKSQKYNYEHTVWYLKQYGVVHSFNRKILETVATTVLNGTSCRDWENAIEAMHFYTLNVCSTKGLHVYHVHYPFSYVYKIAISQPEHDAEYWRNKCLALGTSLDEKMNAQWPFEMGKDWNHLGKKYDKQKRNILKHARDCRYLNNHKV